MVKLNVLPDKFARSVFAFMYTCEAVLFCWLHTPTLALYVITIEWKSHCMLWSVHCIARWHLAVGIVSAVDVVLIIVKFIAILIKLAEYHSSC